MPLGARVQGAPPLRRQVLEAWLRSPHGQQLLALEAAEMTRVLPEVFGRHVLQIGDWGLEGELLNSAETLHHAVLGSFVGAGAAAIMAPEALALPEKSVDAVLLPHTLEFTRSPHDVLREVNRVLNDRGRLFMLGFNPWGATALRGWLGLRPQFFPGGARFYSVSRLHDWLTLLDFEVTEVRRFGSGFPWLAPRSVGDHWNPGSLLAPFAEAYVLMAKKRVLPINLVGRARRAQVKPLVGVTAPAHGARSQANFENNEP